jgi:hypothetical protein
LESRELKDFLIRHILKEIARLNLEEVTQPIDRLEIKARGFAP